MTRLKYTLKTDTLFKLLFTKYPDLLKKLVAALLGIQYDSNRDLWLKLFKAETEEELAKIEEMGVPIMNEAIGAYRHVATSPEFRKIERMRSKARHDEAQALRNAELRGEARGEARSNTKWQRVVADKDALIAELQAKLKNDS